MEARVGRKGVATDEAREALSRIESAAASLSQPAARKSA